jgi:AcrR family transcriptional regulator
VSGQSAGPSKPAAPAKTAEPRRRGRPAGTRATSTDTRDRILIAAREEFAERGYDRTSVRSIGRAAGVDAALVHHYFGTKEQIFAAAIELSFAPAISLPDRLAEGGADSMGERVVRLMLGVWENPLTRGSFLAVLRSAMSNETAAEVFRDMISRRLLSRVAGELDVPDAEFRVQLAASQIVGMAVLRYVVKVEPLASATSDELALIVGPTIERYLTAEKL